MSLFMVSLLTVSLTMCALSTLSHGETLGSFDPNKHQLLLVDAPAGKRTRRSSLSGVNLLEDELDREWSIENDIIDVENSLDNETSRVYSCHVTTHIRYRYARTHITSDVMNKNPKKSSEVVFQMVLPEAAFISKFLMEIDGKVFEAYVKEKEEATKVYTEAKNRGLGAGLVEVNARHSNMFNVNLNLKPSSKVTFNLTYEEFLVRKLGRYEQTINIRPEQISEIPDYKITVYILESQNITLLKVPKIRNDTELEYGIDEENNFDAVISQPTGNSAVVTWKPTVGDRERWRNTLGKFTLCYDIQHNSAVGEILLMNGYFVHFFAPAHVLPLRKHVIYVLDVSGSMNGRKMEQMKSVMSTVMDDLKPDDYFNIIQFSTRSEFIMPKTIASLAEPVMATEFALRQAHQVIQSLNPRGATNIDDAIRDALAISSRVAPTPEKEGIGTLPDNVESIIMFLTDGEPTAGVTVPDSILSNARERNLARVPIYTISFGEAPDFNLLKSLALQNYGFARKIYEGGDADIQIRGFYKEISSPLLSNITFKYTTNSSGINVRKLTKQKFPSIFSGSELVVAGYLNQRKPSTLNDSNPSASPSFLAVNIDANGRDGHVTLSGDDLFRNAYDATKPKNVTSTENPVELEDEFLERLWAYITIKQLLEIHPGHNETDYVEEDFGFEEEEVVEETDGIDEVDLDLHSLQPMASLTSSNETSRDRALKLALKYGFVTPITSLVVVKPDDGIPNTQSSGPTTANAFNDIVNLEEAKVNMASSSKSLSQVPRGISHSSSSASYSSSRGSLRGLPGLPVRDSIPTAKIAMSHSVASLILPPEPKMADTSVIRNYLRSGSASKSGNHFLGLDVPEQIRVSTGARNSLERRAKSFVAAHRVVTTTTKKPIRHLASLIKWPLSTDTDGKSFITAYGTKYFVLPDEVESARFSSQKCTGGSRHKRFYGTCQHLRDCVRNEFKDDMEVYINNYFCTITSAGVQYAGACCAK